MDVSQWSAIQSHILTGGGLLNSALIPNEDFRDPDDLPHFHLREGKSHETYLAWINEDRRSNLLSGCWSRAIFIGGWKESSEHDTEAFNIQTPSIFIDIRIPLNRPTEQLKFRRSLSECRLDELQILSRQHCFGGYTLPEVMSIDLNTGPIFTRHHIIDWNYHPYFPRPRPNRWWVDINEDKSSFKEYSIARDKFNVPIYYERWLRRPNDSQGMKYLALKRITSNNNNTTNTTKQSYREALLVIVGNHFCYASDRITPFPDFPGAAGPAGPPLVDHSIYMITAMSQNRSFDEETHRWRQKIISYLDLEGSYGHVYNISEDSNDIINHTNISKDQNLSWIIEKSTHPWREGQCLWSAEDPPIIMWHNEFDNAATDDNNNRSHSHSLPMKGIQWKGAEWICLECSFNSDEIMQLFPFGNHISSVAPNHHSKL
eukprot:gene12856-27108_t